jgi:hypothetical protein
VLFTRPGVKVRYRTSEEEAAAISLTPFNTLVGQIIRDGSDLFSAINLRFPWEERLTAAMLTTAGVGPDDKLQGLENRMQCRECDVKG